jgi:hypothetical protein
MATVTGLAKGKVWARARARARAKVRANGSAKGWEMARPKGLGKATVTVREK